jgi:hypothetical protein
MKEKLFFVALLCCAVSCNKHNEDVLVDEQANVAIRAQTLGFTDVAAYETYVAQQCANGNHSNCDISTAGTHYACAHTEHQGVKHDGTHHNGTAHNAHNCTNGHKSCSHNSTGHHQ